MPRNEDERLGVKHAEAMGPTSVMSLQATGRGRVGRSWAKVVAELYTSRRRRGFAARVSRQSSVVSGSRLQMHFSVQGCKQGILLRTAKTESALICIVFSHVTPDGPSSTSVF